MSEGGLINIKKANPQIACQFDSDSGNAVPISNVLEVIGGAGIETSGSGNTLTIALTGGGAGIDEINVDTFTAPGTNPVAPTVLGAITTTGGQVASGVVGSSVIRTNSIAANALKVEVQQSGSALLANTALNGVSHFNSNQFNVSNGFVSLLGLGQAIDSIATDSGTAVPNVAGAISIIGGSNITTSASLNTVTINSNVLTVSVPISSAQITNLANDLVLIVPAPPAGYINKLVSGILFYKFVTTEYVGTNTLDLQIVDVEPGPTPHLNFMTFSSSDLLNQIEDVQQMGTFYQTNPFFLPNTVGNPLYLFNSSGVDYSLGDSTLTVIIDYKLIQIP